jgi:dihydrodipicolinate synthase/N-acetylneuraminate lyase
MNFKVQGVIVPIITPFSPDGELNTAAVKPLVDYLIDRGVQGLFPAGTTGEGALLTFTERQQLAEAVVDAADGRVPVIIHAGATTTRATQELVHHPTLLLSSP